MRTRVPSSALLAKTVTTLDVVSAGRAILGIGAGWFQLEHDALGFEFGTFTDRFVRLEEALQIIVPMLAGERPTVDGAWYRVREAINEPRLRERIPVMIGGSGENKTFRLAARFADHVNRPYLQSTMMAVRSGWCPPDRAHARRERAARSARPGPR